MTDDRRFHDPDRRDGARRADSDPDQPPGRPTDDVRGLGEDDEDDIDEVDEEDELEDLDEE